MLRPVALVLAALALPACTLVDPKEGDFSCSADTDCVSGYSCVGAKCRPLVCTGTDCVPDTVIGDPCVDASTCAGTCLTEATGYPRGYCSRECTADADCGAPNAACVQGRCLRHCADDTACRPDYRCVPGEAGASGTCQPSIPPKGPIGAACASDAECESGSCDLASSGGACTQACPTRECPSGASCASVNDALRCYRTCAVTADCREGYVCRPLEAEGSAVCVDPATVPRITGDACVAEADCSPSGLTCDVATPGGMCTATCETDPECGLLGHCATTLYTKRTCIRDCAADGECRSGWSCVDADLDGRTECNADGVGSRGTYGTACESSAACAYGKNATCATLQGISFCTERCETGGCDETGVCVLLPRRTMGFCMKRCDNLTRCPNGLSCEDLGNGDFACVPPPVQ